MVRFVWCYPRDRPGVDRVSPVSTCLKCGGYVPVGESYCGRHRPRRRSAKLRGGGATISRFRAEVLRLAGGRCEAVWDGVRCSETDPAKLEAHHIVAVADGGANDATNGRCLCLGCHARVEGRRAPARRA